MVAGARVFVEGFWTGLHRSPYHGFSVEFTEHRAYQAGDELKYLDWRILGRSDRLFVKQFEEETNLRASVVLDVDSTLSGIEGIDWLDHVSALELTELPASLLVVGAGAVGVSVRVREPDAQAPPVAIAATLAAARATFRWCDRVRTAAKPPSAPAAAARAANWPMKAGSGSSVRTPIRRSGTPCRAPAMCSSLEW